MSNHDNGRRGCLTAMGVIVFLVVALTIVGLCSIVMASDLPEWFKFWLIFG